MTAEIAILNRSALALAADSAVTISVGNKTKVYDTAEKLFELSRRQPIALMIYNNVEFVGVPLDVLIRKFRAEKANQSVYDSIEQASDEFIKYIGSFDHNVIEEKRYLYYIMKQVFREVNDQLSKKMREKIVDFFKTADKKVLTSPSPMLVDILKAKSAIHKEKKLSGFLSKVTLNQFKSRFGDVVAAVCEESFKGVDATPDVIAAASQLGFYLMKSSEGSDLLTGLVFGGFAKKDMFPTLRYLEIDGVFFNTLKVLSKTEVDIDRMNVRAEVVPFAQKEMVERFVYGLDDELGCSVDKFVSSAVDEVIDALAPSGSDKLKKSVRSKIDGRFTKMMKKLRESSRQELLDIVYFMSKKELADIAYALVELTSHKRRFSTDEQTVGGPIDVAILTKNEGFVWIRRKHYFDSDVNPGYASRVQEIYGDGNGSEKPAV